MSGPSGPPPQAYNPTGQGQADQNYQSLTSSAMPWAQNLPGMSIPGMSTAAGNIASNPYNASALSGLTTAQGTGMGAAGGMANSSGMLGNLASLSGTYMPGNAYARANAIGDASASAAHQVVPLGRQVYGQGQTGYDQTQAMIPSTTGGAAYAPGQLSTAQGLAGLTAGGALGAIPGLTQGMGAADAVLGMGFDPQGALHDRLSQQTSDNQNALNSMYGLGSSAYGAGMTGQALTDFNMDWQNQQLQRATQALGAYGAEQGQVTSDLTSLLGSAAGNYASLSNAGVGQYDNLTSTAAGNLNSLVSTGMGAANTGFQDQNTAVATYLQGLQQQQAGLTAGTNNFTALSNNAGELAQTAGNLGQQGAQLQAASAILPQQGYTQQQQQALDAFNSLAAGGGNALAPSNSLASTLGNYMSIGQNATQINQSGWNMEQQAAAQQMAGLGKMVGTVAAMALAPATGGLSLFALGGGMAAAGG